jgi:O-antigen/teichoic acid export membrane protein
MLKRALKRFFRRYLIDPKPKLQARGWRLLAKRSFKVVFYYLPLCFGVVGILVLPFFSPEPFYIAQMLLAVLFIASMRFEVGLGRYGDAMDKHSGWLKRLDHLVLLAGLALIGVMGQTAKTPFFGWLWTGFGVFFLIAYLVKVTGWKPKWLREWHERLEHERLAREQTTSSE